MVKTFSFHWVANLFSPPTHQNSMNLMAKSKVKPNSTVKS